MLRAILIKALIVIVIIAGILVVPRWYLKSQHMQIAERHQYIAQAICDFQAHRGLLPYSLNDLVPEYLSQLPVSAHFSNGSLSIHSGVSYSFRGEYEGWTSGGRIVTGALPVPTVKPSVPVVNGEERIRATLAEYDRRISTYNDDRWHRTQKIAYLISLKQTEDAYAECIAAAKAHPDWWRPQMGLAMLSTNDQKDVAGTNLRKWVEKYPGFVHFWYLAHFYRSEGRIDDALKALRKGTQYPLESIDSDATWTIHGFAFDAATFASKQKRPKLVLELTKMWSSPRGVNSYESPNLYAFRAAALLALGQLDEAKVAAATLTRISDERAIWAGNLENLNAAIRRNDRFFVYDPGVPYDGFFEWTFFPKPDP